MSVLRNRRTGVALLDLMIALLVMGMTALAIAAALGTIGRTGASLTRQDAHLAEAIAVERVQSLAASIPPSLAPEGRVLLVGSHQALSFFTVMTGQEQPIEVVISLDGNEIWAELKGTEREESLRLASGVSDIRLYFWGEPHASAPAQWNTSWERQSLPKLVKITWDHSNSGVPILLEPGLVHSREYRSLKDLVVE